MLRLCQVPAACRYVGRIITPPFFQKLQYFIPIKYRHHSLVATVRDAIPSVDYSPNSCVARCNWLITKLCREGRIFEALKMFNEMPERDVVSWTAMISGYIKSDFIGEARKLFDRVDAQKNVVTWTAMLSGYVKLGRIVEAERLFEDMPVKNVVSWNTMIDGFVRNWDIDKAFELFEKMPERNVVSWNTIISALARCGRITEAREHFDRMPKRDVISWTAMVTGLAENGRIDEARLIFERMPQRNAVSWNAMITGYAKNMRLDEAFELFERMPERDLASWNGMITGFIQNGELSKAETLFNLMPLKNIVSWTTMITGYVQYDKSEEALKIFSKLLAEDGVKPNEGTFVSVLSACSDLAGLGEGQQVHQIIIKTVYQNAEYVVSALINMYSKCGKLGTARKMFDDGIISQRDLISWNGMIAAYAHHGCGEEAISLFNQMRNFGYKPNDVTYVGVLTACSHSGLVEEGLYYFLELVRDKSIQIREDHYSCLVDLCGRAGRLSEAVDFIQQLKGESLQSAWAALLHGCNIHGNIDVGKLAANELFKLEPNNAGTYLLLSNIYASSGKWREASIMRSKMKDKGLKKQPGCSWIEVGNKVHVFVVGDKSHVHANHIYSLLDDLYLKMKSSRSLPRKEDTTDNNFCVTQSSSFFNTGLGDFVFS